MKHTILIVLLLSIAGGNSTAKAQCESPIISGFIRTACTIEVQWTNVPAATSYLVVYRTSTTPWVSISVIDTNSYLLENLIPNTNYAFKIQALSDTCTTVSPRSKCKTELMNAPTGFSADSVSRHEAWISWDLTCGATSYDLQWRTVGSIDWNSLEGIIDTVSVLDSLPANGMYEALVTANSLSGSSGHSDTLLFSTLAYPTPEHPNIILIVTDDSRWDEYRINGAPDYLELPAIERLYNEGVNFNICVVPTPLCTPGRASIYTGLYPTTNGCLRNAENINPGIPVIQEILHDQGYYTAFVGKYGVGLGTPVGFDDWITNSSLHYVDPPYKYNGIDTTFPGNILEVFPQLCLDFLNAAPEDQPYMLMLFHRAPHDSIVPLPEHESLYTYDTMPFPTNFYKYPNNYPDYYVNFQVRWNSDSLETIELRRDAFRALEGIDVGVQQLLDWLEYRGQLDETMIIYTSDNGFMEGAHKLDSKGLALHESLQVPLFIRYPPWFGGQVVTDEIASVIDIPKTILDIAGLEDTFGLQGLHLKDLADGVVHRKEVLHMQSHIEILPDVRSVRSLDYLYTLHSCEDLAEEFFDLTVDPAENINEIFNPAYAALIDIYRNKLDSMRVLVDDTLELFVNPCYMVTDDLRQGNFVLDDSNQNIQVFPNPSNDNIYIRVSVINELVTVRLMDMNGRIYYAQQHQAYPEMIIDIPSADYAEGMYIIELISSEGSIFSQVVITHERKQVP